MTDFFSQLPSILSATKDIILSGTAITAAYVGLAGLGTWHRQLRGNTEYSLAKNLLTCIYELRSAIAVVRNPLASYATEPDLPAEKLTDMDWQKKSWYAQVQMYEGRWSHVVVAKSKLAALLFEVEAVWGKKTSENFKTFVTLIGDLDFAIQGHLEDKDPARARQATIDTEKQTRRRIVLFKRSPGSPDEYNDKLEQAIAKAEEVLRPYIKAHHK